MKRSSLVKAVLALLVGGVGGVKADSIAYNLVDYAALQTGATGSTDISGQVITDGATGSFSSGGFGSHISNVSLSLTTPGGTFVVPSAEVVSYSLFPTDVEVTPSTLSIVGGGCFSLLGLTSQRDLIEVTWYNNLASGSQANPYLIVDLINGNSTSQFSTIIAPPDTLGIETNNTWVFAVQESPSVPEPTVAVGVCISLVGLCTVYLRRRKENEAVAKAMA